MKVLLNAHSETYPVDYRTLGFIRDWELDGVRRNVPRETTENELFQIIRQVNRNDDLFFLLYLDRIGGAATLVEFMNKQLDSANFRFEVGWEATLTGHSPELYALTINSILRDILPVKPIVTTTHRMRKEEYVWLNKFALLVDAEFSVHTYRRHAHFPDEGWDSIEDMFMAIWAAQKGRPWHNTETGWHSSKRGSWPCRKRTSEKEIAEFLNAEINLHRKWGAETFVIYQAYNGPSENNFGLLAEHTLEPLERAYLLKELMNG